MKITPTYVISHLLSKVLNFDILYCEKLQINTCDETF